MSQPKSHPAQEVNLSGLLIEVNIFFICKKWGQAHKCPNVS